MTHGNAIPELQDEINRKSFDTVEWLFQMLRTGQLTPHQFDTGISTIFHAVNGLVDEQMVQIVTEAGKLVANIGPATESRHFIKGNAVVSVKRRAGDEGFDLQSYQAGVSGKCVRTEYDNCRLCKEKFDTICAQLLKAGYAEL